ncbi:MAG TPA: zf-HC2 domain-containing protein, partial [Terriglobales bacterium]|nr:zf-HC2 domain-containing protein [Terriglobales bacterium]
MCEFQAKLIALLDRELSSEEVAAVERHIEGCEECRNRLAGYEVVNETFDAYCDAVMAAKTRRVIPHWMPVLASAAVAAFVIFLAFLEKRIEPPPVLTPTINAVSVPGPMPLLAPSAPEPAPRKKMHRRQAVPAVQERAMKWRPTETAVQIAIPAEAMFPPGAMPKGLNFVAELSIAPDGSVRQ